MPQVSLKLHMLRTKTLTYCGLKYGARHNISITNGLEWCDCDPCRGGRLMAIVKAVQKANRDFAKRTKK